MNNETRAITVWHFDDAPEHLRELSNNGGDEDWLVEVPPGIVDGGYDSVNGLPYWMEGLDSGHMPQICPHPTKDGWSIVIGSH